MKLNKEKDPPTKKLSDYIFWFVIACAGINWGVKLLLEVWWVLVILIFVIAIITILFRLAHRPDEEDEDVSAEPSHPPDVSAPV